MAYNMTENATQSMAQMTQSLNMTTASVNMTQTLNMTTASVSMTQSLEMSSNITLSVSPAPSSVNMSYTASVNATTMSHNSSVWPSSSVSAPFVCRSNESCWVEVECRTRKYDLKRGYVTAISRIFALHEKLPLPLTFDVC